jgi:hypothetical protein
MADAEAKSTPTPQKLSMAFAVGVLARLIPRPREEHLACVKGVLRYWKHIVDYRIIYGSEDATIRGYADADFVADPDRRQSVGGYAYLAGGAVSWGSKLLPTVATSSMEAEYMAHGTALGRPFGFEN